MQSSAWRDEFWGDCERWPVTVLTWRAAEDCSRYEGWQPEKLGHQQLTATYVGQSVTMPRRNADDIELRCLLAGRVRRRGTAVLHLAHTGRPPVTSACREGKGRRLVAFYMLLGLSHTCLLACWLFHWVAAVLRTVESFSQPAPAVPSSVGCTGPSLATFECV